MRLRSAGGEQNRYNDTVLDFHPAAQIPDGFLPVEKIPLVLFVILLIVFP
jgi:hypothetical protein